MADEPKARSRSLTRREFDEVIRRATELAARDSDDSDQGLAEAEVYRIAREVGLGERHVRRALAEVRHANPQGGMLDRLLGPGLVHASRVVPGSVDALAGGIDEFLVGGRLLQRVRRSQDFLQYRPAVDWISQVARAASATSRKYFVASARSVEVHLQPVSDDRTLVEFVVDPGIRGDYVGGAVMGGVAGVAGGIGGAVALVTMTPVAVVLAVPAGVAIAAGVGAGSVRIAASSHRRKVLDVHAEVEGILDRLETGDSLEPPPSSWRRWVERQFHGARRLLDPDEGADGGWG